MQINRDMICSGVFTQHYFHPLLFTPCFLLHVFVSVTICPKNKMSNLHMFFSINENRYRQQISVRPRAYLFNYKLTQACFHVHAIFSLYYFYSKYLTEFQSSRKFTQDCFGCHQDFVILIQCCFLSINDYFSLFKMVSWSFIMFYTFSKLFHIAKGCFIFTEDDDVYLRLLPYCLCMLIPLQDCLWVPIKVLYVLPIFMPCLLKQVFKNSLYDSDVWNKHTKNANWFFAWLLTLISKSTHGNVEA